MVFGSVYIKQMKEYMNGTITTRLSTKTELSGQRTNRTIITTPTVLCLPDILNIAGTMYLVQAVMEYYANDT